MNIRKLTNEGLQAIANHNGGWVTIVLHRIRHRGRTDICRALVDRIKRQPVCWPHRIGPAL